MFNSMISIEMADNSKTFTTELFIAVLSIKDKNRNFQQICLPRPSPGEIHNIIIKTVN